jgi:hypothetical protein
VFPFRDRIAIVCETEEQTDLTEEQTDLTMGGLQTVVASPARISAQLKPSQA